jgi:hypothetical protein
MSGAQILLSLALISCTLVLAFGWLTVHRGSWGALAKRLAALATLGVVALWGYSHRPAPDRGDCALPAGPGELGSICDVRKPEDLVSEPGSELATATSALEVGPYVFIGSMLDDRVGVYRRR